MKDINAAHQVEERTRKNEYGPQPWDRLDGEPKRMWELFCIYRDKGLTRSVTQMADELNRSRSTLATYSSRYAWVIRAAAYDAELDRQQQLALIEDRKAAARKHYATAKTIQGKAVQQLVQLDPATLTNMELIKYIEAATRMEREALNMDQRQVDVTVNGTVATVNAMSPSDVRIRLESLRQEIDARLDEEDK